MIKMAFVSMAVVVLASAAAQAGGMGDSSARLRQMNATCEAQKRGEGPLFPNMCLPEYPPAPVESPERRRLK